MMLFSLLESLARAGTAGQQHCALDLFGRPGTYRVVSAAFPKQARGCLMGTAHSSSMQAVQLLCWKSMCQRADSCLPGSPEMRGAAPEASGGRICKAADMTPYEGRMTAERTAGVFACREPRLS